MEYFLLKLLLIFMVYFTTYTKQIDCQYREIGPNLPVSSAVKKENYLMIGKIFDQESTIKTGDLMDCEIIKTTSQESNNYDNHVFTQISTTNDGYVFFPASKYKKCFSFQVRTALSPHILLSATSTVVQAQKLEIILEFPTRSVIRKNGTILSTIPIKGIVNDQELRGFWIRWLDDYLLEFGRDIDDSPIVSYRIPEKLSINFVAILSHTTTAEWILHEDPHCGTYNITKIIQADSKCKVATTKLNCDNNKLGTTNFNSEEIKILQKLQEHILNQIKNQHRIFKLNKLPSKEIILVYQKLIEILYINAEENQKKIYDLNDKINCPLKSITFNKISEEYLEFMIELQIELASFNQTAPSEINCVNQTMISQIDIRGSGT